MNKCKIARKRITGGHCIKSIRGMVTWYDEIETWLGITYDKQNYVNKTFYFNLLLRRHLLLSSDLLLSVVAGLDCGIASFSARQRLHNFARGWYGLVSAAMLHSMVRFVPASLAFQTAFDSSVAFLLCRCTKLCLWLLKQVLNTVSLQP